MASSSSDDDIPLVRTTGNGVKSMDRIPKKLDKALDRSNPSTSTSSSNGHINPGVSIRMGPVHERDVHGDGSHKINGVTNGKRKSRTSIVSTKSYREFSSSDGDDDDDKPLSKRRKTSVDFHPDSDSEDSDLPLARKKPAVQKPPKLSASQIGEKDDPRAPIAKKLIKQKINIEQAAEKTAKKIQANDSKADAQKRKRIERILEDSDDDDDDDDVPLVKSKKPKGSSNGFKPKYSDSDSDVPISKRKKKSSSTKKANDKAAAASASKKSKGNVSKSEQTEEDLDAEDDDEEEYRWWEDTAKGDGTRKWTTLEHSGVVFPPSYQPLPSNVKLIYDGVPVTMHMDAEEIAGFYGAMLNSTVNVTNPTFNKNFFTDFKEALGKTGHAKDASGNPVKIKSFEKCNFSKIFEYYDAEREKKRALPAAEKKAAKAAKDEAEAPYMHCMWDGRKQKVGNFRVEPPGLFRGRGEHPKTGKVKQRVKPEQVTINIGKDAKIPDPPKGHRWKEVKHDPEGTWLAMWQENINGAYKYVMLAANSDIKGQSDYKKFEKARDLKRHIHRIRKDYTRDLKSGIMADRQRATAVYLIDKFALRAGNEKGEDEADTVGCCSLKFEHVSLRPPNTVIFDFLGKDSIRFYDEVEVDSQVFKNLKIFKRPPKTEGDEIFDRLTTSALNKHLGTYMQGLTAKVFRTYNASWTMANLLKDMKSTGTNAEKVKDYNDANRRVAILCNHKRTVAAGHASQIEKMQEKINALRYQQWRCKQMMLDLDPKLKKRRGADYFARPEDLDAEWMKKHQAAEIEEKRQKIQKKFEKDNEKLVAEGSKPQGQKALAQKLEEVDELTEKYKKENKTGKVEAEGKGPTVEKLEANLEKLEQRIATMKVQVQDKDDNKEVALGTSKINYIDPRLTVVFSKKFGVPIERFFSKTLREKFDWAIKSVDESWEF